MIGMYDWIQRKVSAENCISKAENYIATRDGVNLVSNEISSAIYWAVEGWLRQKGIRPNLGNGWHSMIVQYIEESRSSHASEVSYLLSASVFLEIESTEDTASSGFSIDEWIEKANEYLARTKRLIKDMEEELSL